MTKPAYAVAITTTHRVLPLTLQALAIGPRVCQGASSRHPVPIQIACRSCRTKRSGLYLARDSTAALANCWWGRSVERAQGTVRPLRLALQPAARARGRELPQLVGVVGVRRWRQSLSSVVYVVVTSTPARASRRWWRWVQRTMPCANSTDPSVRRCRARQDAHPPARPLLSCLARQAAGQTHAHTHTHTLVVHCTVKRTRARGHPKGGLAASRQLGKQGEARQRSCCS